MPGPLKRRVLGVSLLADGQESRNVRLGATGRDSLYTAQVQRQCVCRSGPQGVLNYIVKSGDNASG